MACYETPKEKCNNYNLENCSNNADIKDSKLRSNKYQQNTKSLTQQTILKSLGRIGICLNEKQTTSISANDLNKVCFILINIQDNDNNNELGFDSLNDGYLVGLKHHRHEYKVFYLYNPSSSEFSSFLCFFLKNTKQALTVFYSGRGSNDKEGIEFKDDAISKSSINHFILHECEGNKQVMFITDCINGGSVFDISGVDRELNLISFSVSKSNFSDENKRPHGIFTYYFCKLTNDFPNITPSRLIERMNPQLHLFNQNFSCQTSKTELFNRPVFIL